MLAKWLWNPVTAWNASSVVTWVQAAVTSYLAPNWAREHVPQLWHRVVEFSVSARDVIVELLFNTS